MDMKSFKMLPGTDRVFESAGDETAVVLLRGKVTFDVSGTKYTARRDSFIRDGLWCLHAARNTLIKVTALEESEIVSVSTENDAEFAPVFYTPENTRENMACENIWNNSAVRKVRTAFEYTNAPYSNLVLGETVMYPGCWSGFVPHYHVQPEVYYFRMENPDGFGASFVGEEVFKIKDGSFCAVGRNLVHPQVAAPGYPIYYLWLIRHLPGDPWVREKCSNERVHEWLLGQKA